MRGARPLPRASRRSPDPLPQPPANRFLIRIQDAPRAAPGGAHARARARGAGAQRGGGGPARRARAQGPPPPYCCPYPSPYRTHPSGTGTRGANSSGTASCTRRKSGATARRQACSRRCGATARGASCGGARWATCCRPPPPPSLLLPLPVSLLYTHSLTPYCCPYRASSCGATCSRASRSRGSTSLECAPPPPPPLPVLTGHVSSFSPY